MHVLIIEDEPDIAEHVKRGLEIENHRAQIALDGRQGLAMAEEGDYDVIVLDILMPYIDGIEVCRRLREARNRTPIIMLTARDTVEDRIRGLDVGADDYLVKPFLFDELLSRLHALARRPAELQDTLLRVGDLTLDPATHEVTRAGREIVLTSKEYQVLDYLMRRPGVVCTRTMIIDHAWGFEAVPTKANNLDAFISHLRKKDRPGFP